MIELLTAIQAYGGFLAVFFGPFLIPAAIVYLA